MENIMEIPGDGGSNAKPSGPENPVGWGVKLRKKKTKKTLLLGGGGGMNIFWNHTIYLCPSCERKHILLRKENYVQHCF